MYLKEYAITITTNAQGAGTGYSESVDYGELREIVYPTADFASGVAMAVTDEKYGLPLLTIAAAGMNTAKRWNVTDTAETAAGAEVVDALVRASLVNNRIKAVITGGGANVTSQIIAIVG